MPLGTEFTQSFLLFEVQSRLRSKEHGQLVVRPNPPAAPQAEAAASSSSTRPNSGQEANIQFQAVDQEGTPVAVMREDGRVFAPGKSAPLGTLFASKPEA